MLRRSMAIAALTAAVGLGGCGGSDEPPTCEDPEAVTSVTMDDFSYAPGCVEAPAGAEIEIVNEGRSPHTFTVEAEAAGDEVDVPAGDQATLSVPDLAAGTYRVICTYHPQMKASLRVTG